MFTKEEIEILARYEQQFKTALNEGYARGITEGMVRIIKPIFDKETNSTEKVNLTCAHCVLQFLKRVGKIYFEQVQDRTELTPIEKARMAKKNKQATNK